MPRPKRSSPTQRLHLELDASKLGEAALYLASPLTATVPNGAWRQLFDALLTRWLQEQRAARTGESQ